jgi:hypothetical protein
VSRWGEREGDVLDAVKTMDKSTLNFHKDWFHGHRYGGLRMMNFTPTISQSHNYFYLITQNLDNTADG